MLGTDPYVNAHQSNADPRKENIRLNQGAFHSIIQAASRATNAAPKENRFAGASLVITEVVLAVGTEVVMVPLPPLLPDPELPEPEPEPEPPLPELPDPEPAPVGFVGVPGRVAVAPPAPPLTPDAPTVTTLPAPAEIPGEPPSAPLPVAAAAEDTAAPPAPPAVAVPEAEDDEDDEALQERS